MCKTKLIHASNIFLRRPLCNEPQVGIIHSLLENYGYDCESLYNIDKSLAEDTIVNESTDYLGICLNFFSNINEIIAFCDRIKRRVPDIILVLFGLFTNCDDDYLLNNFGTVFNFIIKGEPEISFFDIVKNKKNSPKCSIIYSTDICDIKLPPPKKNMKNELSTYISRGCLNKCLFCEESFQHYTYRTVEAVIVEMRNHVLTSDRSRDCWMFFMDLDFLSITVWDSDYIKKLVNEWRREKLNIKFTIQTRADRIITNIDNLKLLKSIGLQNVTLGVESGSEEILNRFNKNIKGANVNVEAIEELKALGILHNLSFIMFEPLTTLNNIKQNLSFFQKIDFPIGAIPSQPPVSFLDKLIILHGSKSFEYYSDYCIKYTVDNYNIRYEFSDPDVKLYYYNIIAWREKIGHVMNNYYCLVNKLLYNDVDFSESLKIQRIGIIIKKTDLEFMVALLDAIQNHLNIDVVMKKYISIMNVDIQNKIDKLGVKYASEERQFRGWHGPMNVLLNADDIAED